jgi:hypothetical protein
LHEADEETVERKGCSNHIACGVRRSVGLGDGVEVGRSEGSGWQEDRSVDEEEAGENVP